MSKFNTGDNVVAKSGDNRVFEVCENMDVDGVDALLLKTKKESGFLYPENWFRKAEVNEVTLGYRIDASNP